jgi:hypothetical protein
VIEPDLRDFKGLAIRLAAQHETALHHGQVEQGKAEKREYKGYDKGGDDGGSALAAYETLPACGHR